MKHSFITLGRIIANGCRNLTRNAWLSIAAVAVMIVALTIISGSVVLNIATRKLISEVSKDYKVSIYLEDSATQLDRNRLEVALKANTNVANVEFVDRDEAYRRFLEQSKQDQALVQGLAIAGADTLPTSFDVSVKDLQHVNEVADIANGSTFKKTVNDVTIGRTDSQKTIDRAAAIQHFITRASIFSAMVFAAVSILIIFNTIRIAIFTRSEEIRIMKLIGATPNYIRGPYLVESALYGIIAGVISIAAIYGAILSLGNKFADFHSTYELFTRGSVILIMVGGTIAAGIVVGFFSSMLAMEKYLKLKKW